MEKKDQEFDPTELLAAKGVTGLTKKALSEMTARDQKTVSKVLDGEDTMISTLKRVGQALGCKVTIQIERGAAVEGEAA